jgi:Transglycosylase SLT domain
VIAAGFAAQQASTETETVLNAAPTSPAFAQTGPAVLATATSTSMPEAIPTETAIPMRIDCDVVNETGFVSWEEQEWFYANCITPVAEPTAVPDVALQSEVLGVITEAPPTPTPQPPPPRPRPVVPIGAIEEMVCSYAWDCSWALSVMYCESGGNPNAYNPAGPYIGLFQIHESLGTDLYDPATNIATAYSLYLSHGPSAWGGCA